MKISTIILLISFLCATAAFAEYNPATGEDDIVLISEAQEVRMAKSLAKKVEKQFGFAKDAGIQERVTEIGQKIVAVCDRPQITYSFVVLEGKGLEEDQRYNAFALPGGYVYIFKDMAEDMQSDDELAAILAHEVGHIVAKHGIKKLQGSVGITALRLLGAVSKTDDYTNAKSSVAIAELMMAHSRQAEFEADRLSVRYLKKAGFDPEAAATFMEKLLKKQLKGKIHRYQYFHTHPYTSERKVMLNKEIKGKFAFDDYINAPAEKDKPF